MGRLLYPGHLARLLWWLLDRSPEQRAAPALRVPGVSPPVLTAAALAREALLGDASATETVWCAATGEPSRPPPSSRAGPPFTAAGEPHDTAVTDY